MPPVAWGWEIWLYFFIGGVSGGAVATAAIVDLLRDGHARRLIRLATTIAVPLLALSLLLLTIDLGRPERLTNLLTAFRPTSPMWWGTFLLTGAVAGSGVLLLMARPEGTRLTWWERSLRHLTVLFSVGLVVYTAVLLADSSRPMWSATPLLPALFALSGLSTGIAALALGSHWGSTRMEEGLERAELPIILSELAVIAAFLAWLAWGGGPAGAKAAQVVVSDPLIGAMFWVVVVALGLVIPAIALYRRSLLPTTVRPALVLLGGLALRIVIIVGGQATPLA